MSDETIVYCCTRCTTTAGEGGTCDLCGGQRVECRPGDHGDPLRRPLMDAGGNVRTRAPIWWLRYTIPALIGKKEE